MSFRFEITDKNEVFIWDLDNPNPEDKPHIYQPFHPDTGETWTSKAEIEEWLDVYLPMMEARKAELTKALEAEIVDEAAE